MKTIDFKHFKVWRDMGAEKPVELDARREVANYLLSSLGGVEGMDLSLRVYRSDGPLELEDAHFELIRGAMSRPLDRGGVIAAMYYSLLRNAGLYPQEPADQ